MQCPGWCYRLMSAENGSIRSSPMSEKSAMLRVTSAVRFASAMAAIMASMGSTGRPIRSRSARRRPKQIADSTSNERIRPRYPFVKSVSKADLKRSLRLPSSSRSTPYRSSATTGVQMNRCCSGWESSHAMTDGFGLSRQISETTFVSSSIIRNQAAATQDQELRRPDRRRDLPAAPSFSSTFPSCARLPER